MITINLKQLPIHNKTIKMLADAIDMKVEEYKAFINTSTKNIDLFTLGRLAMSLEIANLHDILDIKGIEYKPHNNGIICNLDVQWFKLQPFNIQPQVNPITLKELEDILNKINPKYLDDILIIRQLPNITPLWKRLIGKKFQHLRILDIQSKEGTKRKKRRIAYCLCDCGTYKWIDLNNVIHRGQVACDRTCEYNPVTNNYKPWINKRFGHLTVMDVFKKPLQSGAKAWYAKCTCDCGNIVDIYCGDILYHHQQCCNRYCQYFTKPLSKKITNLIGKKVGIFTILDIYKRNTKENSNRKTETIAKCICDCGLKKEINFHHLKRLKSCGVDCFFYDHPYTKPKTQIEKTDVSKLNSIPGKANTSGVVGVYYIPKADAWRASITFKGKHYYLGQFSDFKLAVAARKEGEKKYFAPILKKYKENLNK